MKNSKLIELFRTFTKSECKVFDDFVRSPYFNKNDDVIELWNYLKTIWPTFNDKQIEKERVFRKVFPDAPYDEKLLSYTMNYLLKTGESFLQQQYLEAHPLIHKYSLLSAFMERKLFKHFKYTYKKCAEYLKNEALGSVEKLFYQSKITELFSDYNINEGVKDEPFLKMASDQFDEFLFLAKIKYSCEMLNRTKLVSPGFDIAFMEEIEQKLHNQSISSTIIQLFFKIYQLYNEPGNEALFESLILLLDKTEKTIDHSELKAIYLYAINLSIINIRQGKQQYVETCFDLYRNGIASQALFDRGELSTGSYTNTIRLGIMLKRFDLVENFIQEYYQYLPKESREDARFYNLALVAFNRFDYDTAISQLFQMPFLDPDYNISNRVLLIKSYYETDNIEPMLSAVASFNIYLKRNKKISSNIKRTYLHFCNIFSQIMRRREKKKDSIKEKIDQTHPLIERDWLRKVWEEQFA